MPSSSQILLLVTVAQIPDKPMHQNKVRTASGSYLYHQNWGYLF